MKSKPLVEVITLNKNGGDHIFNCLDSLKNCNYPNFKVTVIDQNSSDGSPEKIAKFYPWVNLVRNKKGRGFAGGNNQALRKTKAKYCILLNDDTEQNPDWIEKLVEVAEMDDNIAALQPKVRALKDRKMFEYAGAAGGYVDFYGYAFCRGRVFFDVEMDLNQYEDSREVFWCCGAAMFLRTSVLKEIGYLDEDFFIYAEELDLSWRINLAGYKQVYVPKSIIFHIGSATIGGDLDRNLNSEKIYYLHRNTWMAFLKNYSIRSLLRFTPLKLMLELLAIARFFLFQPRRSLAIITANLWILSHPVMIYNKHKKIQQLRKVPDKILKNKMCQKSIVLGYFISGKKHFRDYSPNIASYPKLKYPYP